MPRLKKRTTAPAEMPPATRLMQLPLKAIEAALNEARIMAGTVANRLEAHVLQAMQDAYNQGVADGRQAEREGR